MRWKLTAVLGWGIVGLGLLMGASTRNEVRAKRLVIEDEKGRDRIVLQTLNGLPVATFYDGSDVARLHLMLTEGGHPDISLHDEKARNRVSLSVSDEGIPIFNLLGPNDGSEVRMGVAAGSALIEVRGKGGTNSLSPP